MTDEIAGRYKEYGKASPQDLLKAMDITAEAGSDTYRYLENVLRVRAAEMVFNGSAQTASATAESSKIIQDSIDTLTKAIERSSADTQAATVQSAILARRLNMFTLVLAIATVMMVVATGCQAWETKRQADAAAMTVRPVASPARP